MSIRKTMMRFALLLCIPVFSNAALAINNANANQIKPLIETDSSSATPLSFLNKAAQSFSLFGSDPANDLLPAEEAFPFLATVKDSNTVLLH